MSSEESNGFNIFSHLEWRCPGCGKIWPCTISTCPICDDGEDDDN